MAESMGELTAAPKAWSMVGCWVASMDVNVYSATVRIYAHRTYANLKKNTKLESRH